MLKLKGPILVIFLVHFLNVSFAADKVEEKKEGSYGNVAVNETLLKMFQVPGVKAIHEECTKSFTTRIEKIPSCVWEAVEKNQEQKKAVLAIYAAEAKASKSNSGNSRSPASEKTSTALTGKVLPVTIDYSSDPTVQALSEYFGKKLDEILDPTKALTLEEQKAGKILSTDHKKFIDLYKSELGKTIINAFTSYCLDTSSLSCGVNSDYCLISESEHMRKQQREENIKSLKNENLDLNSQSSVAKRWNNCIVSVPKTCDMKDDKSSDDKVYSKQRACIIVDYVKSARKSIMVADEQKKFYDELAKSNGPGGGIASNFQAITDENKTSADAVLTITGKDVEDSLKKTKEKDLAEFDKCLKGDKLNEELCKKFLNTKTDLNSKSLTELTLRQNAQGEALKEELNSSPTKVVSYLKEEGYEDQEISKITQDKDSLEKIKKQIIDRYTSQKDAIIKEMADRIKSKTSEEDGKISNSQGNRSKLVDIKNSINSKSSDLANLVQFNNIVSSYLSIDSGDKKVERNTASLFAETRSMNKDEAKVVMKKIEEAKLVDKKNNADLNVNTINESFLKYDEMKKVKPQ